jgi:hypothetical protein
MEGVGLASLELYLFGGCVARRDWNFAKSGKPEAMNQKLYRSEDPEKDRHRSPRDEPVAAQGQNDEGVVELGKVSRRKHYQSWLPKNLS